MDTETLKTVSAALKLVDSKKENLRQAFEDLQSHHSSSYLSSPLTTLTWPDLDSHFSSLHSSLLSQFHLLQQQSPNQPQLQPSKLNPIQSQLQPSKPNPIQQQSHQSKQIPIESQLQLSKQIPIQSQSGPPNKPLPNPRRSSSAIVLKNSQSGEDGRVKVRPEIKYLCEKMDGPGSRDYIGNNCAQREEIRCELASALGYAQEAAAMVLDAVVGNVMTSSRVVLLESLTKLKPEIRSEVRARAERLAAEWRGKKVGRMEAFGFLNLVAAFGLVGGGGFSVEDLVNFGVLARDTNELLNCFGCLVLGRGYLVSILSFFLSVSVYNYFLGKDVCDPISSRVGY